MTLPQIILVALGAIAFLSVVVRLYLKFHSQPAPPIIGPFLNSPLRRVTQPSARVIERSGVKPGMTMLDLGCGSGAFTLPAARVVGERGKVYALDIQPAMLRQLERRLARARNHDIKNVELKQASAYELPLADGALDLVMSVAAFHEIPDKPRALREVQRVLKKDGILALTELILDPDYPLATTTIKEGEAAGFVFEAKLGTFWDYTVRFRKP
ncbi:MAG: methyltransferase domain-containing protein [Dehalococcoidales bacterium]|nr:methyltransferase domain-containing protein [Dehalococcoidales bacterium]